MADNSSFVWFALLGVGTFGIAYAFIPAFAKQVNGIFGGFGGQTTTGSCSELCARKECSTYLNKCGTKGCEACNCGKLCSMGLCATLRAQCPGHACSNCTGITILPGSNCRFITDPKNGAKYTIWKGTGCSGGYLRNGLEAAVSGSNCSAAREAFIKAYKCPSKYARAYEATFETVTVA